MPSHALSWNFPRVEMTAHVFTRFPAFCACLTNVTQSKAQTPYAGALTFRVNPPLSTPLSLYHHPLKKTDLLRKLFYNYLQSLFKFLLGIFLLFLDGVYDAWIRSSLPLEQSVNLQTSTNVPIASPIYKKSSQKNLLLAVWIKNKDKTIKGESCVCDESVLNKLKSISYRSVHLLMTELRHNMVNTHWPLTTHIQNFIRWKNLRY